MDHGMNDIEALAVLDPARGSEPTEAQWARSRAAVERALAGPSVARGPRWLAAVLNDPRAARGPRRLAVVLAAAAAGVIAALVLPIVVPDARDQAIASWVGTPTARTGSQVLSQARACAGARVGGVSSTFQASDVLLAEQRGRGTLLVMRKGGSTVECTLLGGDPSSALLAAPGDVTAPPAPAAVEMGMMSSSGDCRVAYVFVRRCHDDELMSELVGRAGADVTAVQVRLDDGRTFQASVGSGWYAAWWPGPAGGLAGDHLTIIVHAAGRTISYRPSQLQ